MPNWRASVNQIPQDELKDGGFYKIFARNFSYGVYRAKSKGFIGIRTKFGNQYLDTEYYFESERGTAFPKKFLEECSVRPISEYIDNKPNQELFNWIQEAQVKYADED